jgi:hypothetical protein
MSESFTTALDVDKFARETATALEFTGDHCDGLELRIVRIEECLAARWPRSLILRWKLAREIRASVAGYPHEYIPRGDFYGRRIQAASDAIIIAQTERESRRARRAGGAI